MATEIVELREDTVAEAKTVPAPPKIIENADRGRNFTLLVPVLGTIAWILIWRMGIISAIVAWGISALTIYLYERGAGVITRSSLRWIITMILFSIAVAFLGGMASDALGYYMGEAKVGAVTALTSYDFWGLYLGSLQSLEVWTGYATDILVTLGFAIFGAYGTVASLIVETKPVAVEDPKASAEATVKS